MRMCAGGVSEDYEKTARSCVGDMGVGSIYRLWWGMGLGLGRGRGRHWKNYRREKRQKPPLRESSVSEYRRYLPRRREGGGGI